MKTTRHAPALFALALASCSGGGEGGFSAREMAESVNRLLPGARFTYSPDPVRNAILQSWPSQLEDSDAVRDWRWESRFDLGRMTEQMIRVLQAE